MYLKALKLKNFRKFSTEQTLIFAHDLNFENNNSDEKEDSSDKYNVASDLTLVVGKNNSGKTSVINALHKLIGKDKFKDKDFNFGYLTALLLEYQKNNHEELPKIHFELLVGSDDPENDRMNNIYPFVDQQEEKESNVDTENSNEKTEASSVESEENSKATKEDLIYKIKAIYEPHEVEAMKVDLQEKINEDSILDDLLEIIKNSKYSVRYYRDDGQLVEGFKLNQLVELEFIEANQVKDDQILSKSFSKIFDNNLKNNADEETTASIQGNIYNFNYNISKAANEKIAKDTKKSLEEIIHTATMSMQLDGNLAMDKLFSQAITYSYTENDYVIPEDQYGLGYTNLVTIIAKIIDYIEIYRENAFQSKINVLAIEEPETFMHPQMQELFIKNVNNVVNSVISSLEKDVRLQVIITTHSSHMLNSKLKSSQSLDYINYLTYTDGELKSISLDDEAVIPEEVRTKYKDEEKSLQHELRFLMTHLTYKTSELFFSDAIIIVEGPTEENIIRYYIDNDRRFEKLRKFYITIFNIDGAHANKYYALINTLGIPCIITTDLDIKVTTGNRIGNILHNLITDEMITTNETLKFYLSDSDESNELKVSDITQTSEEYIHEKSNMRVYTQHKPIEDYVATSFEEAVILTNYKNEILNKTLKNTRTQIYNDITNKGEDYEKNKDQSFRWQQSLEKEKTKFSNNLLFNLINRDLTNEDDLPKLPDYIADGLKFLEEKLEGNYQIQEED